MRLLLQYLPLREGDADRAELISDHDGDVTADDVVSLPEPLGPKRVRAVTERGADLGSIHGDHGTLQELLSQGWRTSMSDLPLGGDDPDTGLAPDIGVSLHEWTTRWGQIEEDWPNSPGEALEEAADLLGERGVPTGADAAMPETEDAVRPTCRRVTSPVDGDATSRARTTS